MSQSQKKWKQILSHYKMNHPQFFPQSIVNFQDFVQEIKQKLMGFLSDNKKQTVEAATNKLIDLINSSVPAMTLHCVVKKIAVLHALLHRSRLKQFGDSLSRCVVNQINIVINENLIEVTTKQSQKRESSLSKVQGLIRKLSGSKDRSQSKNGKMVLQSQKQKGALIQIIAKIVRPFCFYLLKLTQNFDLYWRVKTKKDENDKAVLWKIVNWSKTLGTIIVETHRLGRYFKDDLLTLSVYFNYLICLDMSDYYDIIKKHIEKESQKWKKIIKRNEKELLDFNYQNDPEAYMESEEQMHKDFLNNPDLLELKELIIETRSVKQKLNYVFGNSLLVSWHPYFTRPSKFTFSTKVTKEEANIDFILEYFQKQNKLQNKFNESYYGKFESISKYDTEQTLYKESPHKEERKSNSLQKQIISGSQIFDNIGQSSLLSKIQKVKMPKARLNKFLHPSVQKQKILNQIILFKCQHTNKIQFMPRGKAKQVFNQ